MRMAWAGRAVVALAVVGTAVANPVQAQRSRAAAPAMASGPAALAGRWEGTYTNDVTQKGGRLVITLAGSDESASGEVAFTPTGAKSPILAEGATMGKGGPGGVPATLMKSGEDKVTGSINASYVDPGCNCTVVTTVDATLNGSTLTGTFAARDSRTGQWNFTSFSATKRAK